MKHTIFAILFLFPLFSNAQPGIITTIAGNGAFTSAGDSTLADSASFKPDGIAVDRHGNVFISDNYFNKIRKFQEGSTMYTAVGNGYPGYTGDGGPASAATVSTPKGLCFDNTGNLFISDAGNHSIRKVNLSDTISSVITTSTGIGITGVFADGAGNIFFADGNTKVWRHSTSGTLTAVAGSGTVGYSGDGGAATNAAFDGCVAVCVDVIGNIYIADKNNNVVRKVDTAGIVSRFAGTGAAAFSGDGGAASAARINGPNDVKADAYGNIYICDQNNCRIRKVNASGIISTIAGSSSALGFSGDGGQATNAQLASPAAICINDSGDIYIADSHNYRVRKIGHSAGSSSLQTQPVTEKKIDVAVYPNPSTGTFSVAIKNLDENPILEIYNAAGAKVYIKVLLSSHTEVSLHQPTGIYLLKIQSGQNTFSRRIQIEQPGE